MSLSSATTMLRRHTGRISLKSCAFFLCDIQERFRPLIYQMPAVIQTGKLMTEISSTLKIPLIVSEQYPKAFGTTVPEIPLLPSSPSATSSDTSSSSNGNEMNDNNLIYRFEKTRFSMWNDDLSSHLKNLQTKSVVLFGIEAHVCIQQTALDLIDNGYDVHLLADGTSSQRPYDRAVAMKRLEQAGVCLTTTESLVFMLMEDSKHPQFKTVSGMIRDHNKIENPFQSLHSI